MRVTNLHLSSAILLSAMALSAGGQTPPAPTTSVQDQSQPSPPAAYPAEQFDSASAPAMHTVEQLLDFADSDVKFDLRDLMEILRDRRHEGWVLAAYPDPKTGHPLIGAGFSLDLPAREHLQPDQVNPHPFLEPSSAELWQSCWIGSGTAANDPRSISQSPGSLVQEGISPKNQNADTTNHRRGSDAPAPCFSNSGYLQCQSLLSRLRSIDAFAANGFEPAGVSDGSQPPGIQSISWPD